MPPLSEHQSSYITKMLLIGDSGAGKSGSVASLAAAGYNLRIIDLDNGIDVLKGYLGDPKGPYGPEAIRRVEYETLTDKMKAGPKGTLVPSKATVWQRTIALLENWKTSSANFGPIHTWSHKDVLVIDSLSSLSRAALNFVLMLNGRLGQRIEQSDWYAGQQLVEGLLQMLYDEAVGCNIIMIAHITYIGEENGPQHGYPNCLGKALPPKVGTYFNSALMARSTGAGSTKKHTIHTTTQGIIELKNTAPLKVLPSYPLATGLADYFKAVRGQGQGTGPGVGPANAKPEPEPEVPSFEDQLAAAPGHAEGAAK